MKFPNWLIATAAFWILVGIAAAIRRDVLAVIVCIGSVGLVAQLFLVIRTKDHRLAGLRHIIALQDAKLKRLEQGAANGRR